MIDSASETLMSLAQAANALPRRRRGCKVHVSCLYRWTKVGCRGIVLESLQIGGTRCTSQQALQRFFERLSALVHTGADASPGVGHRTLAQRNRAAAEAGRRLIEAGA
jgi:hypothetical protein